MENTSISIKKHEYYMNLALSEAHKGILKGENFFGACIVLNEQLISCVHDKVYSNHDLSCHAEVMAIKAACGSQKTLDLSGATLYTTCEPCPICFTLCHNAKIRTIVYAMSIEEVKKHMRFSSTFSSKIMKKNLNSPIEIIGGILSKKAQEQISLWKKTRGI